MLDEQNGQDRLKKRPNVASRKSIDLFHLGHYTKEASPDSLARLPALSSFQHVFERTFFDTEHAARVNQVQEERVKLRGTVQLQARAQNARWLAQRASLSMGPSTFTVDPGDVKVSGAVVWHQELRNLLDSACPCLLGADKLLQELFLHTGMPCPQ